MGDITTVQDKSRIQKNLIKQKEILENSFLEKTALQETTSQKSSLSESTLREELGLAYQILSDLNMDDLTYTHLSARIPGADTFYIYPFGLLFSEVTPENLLTVNVAGEVLQGSELQYNQTGYNIHSAIYRARPDINAIFHLHTPATVAVSCMECGLLPLSQFAFHFYRRLSYHHYDSLVLDGARQGSQLVQDLGENKVLLLRNHGSLTCGTTIHEAFFYMYYLEQACKVQLAALATGKPLVFPSPEVCERAAVDMRNFEPNLGFRDWQALKRRLLNKRKEDKK